MSLGEGERASQLLNFWCCFLGGSDGAYLGNKDLKSCIFFYERKRALVSAEIWNFLKQQNSQTKFSENIYTLILLGLDNKLRLLRTELNWSGFWGIIQWAGKEHFESQRLLLIDIYTLLLPLLLSHFSRVRLCMTPSLGFSRQEHWSGLPFPSPMHKSEKWKWSRSVMSDSSRPQGLQPTRLLRPWDFPGKSTGVGCHCLLWYTHYYT